MRGEYQTDPRMFAVTMAMAALSSARVRDGAVFSKKWNLPTLADPASEMFFAEAEHSLRERREHTSVELEYLQTAALLAITAIQHGKRRLMYTYLGLYHSFIDMDGAHDEVNWPKEMTSNKIEERRCLFWSIYTLDVYASVVWGRTIRHREAHAYVNYPNSSENAGSPSFGRHDSYDGEVSWMDGWNFTTDLYRVLENALDRCRRRFCYFKARRNMAELIPQGSDPTFDALQLVSEMYAALPSRFKSMPVATNDDEHKLNFQAANIAATLQLVKMVAFAAEESTVSRRCDTARELLEAFSNVPIIYLKAISSPLLHHLAGVAIILVFAIETELTDTDFQEVKSLLTSLGDMVAGLESHLSQGIGASTQIRSLIQHLDECWQSGRINMSNIMAAIPSRSQAAVPHEERNLVGTSANESELALGQSIQGLLEDWSWVFNPAIDSW